MAPIKDETVDALKDLVHKLEARVQDLESRLLHGDGGAGTSRAGSGGMRMVLMGPPGAGMVTVTGACWLL